MLHKDGHTQVFIRFQWLKALTIKEKMIKALPLKIFTKTVSFQTDALVLADFFVTISSNICITAPCTIAVTHSILLILQCSKDHKNNLAKYVFQKCHK